MVEVHPVFLSHHSQQSRAEQKTTSENLFDMSSEGDLLLHTLGLRGYNFMLYSLNDYFTFTLSIEGLPLHNELGSKTKI